MSILLKNIILNGREQDIFIDGKIKKIGRRLNLKAGEKIDGKGEKAVLPGLINCHTHAAMALFRGYADDLPLNKWLNEKIWPLEAKLTEEDIYWGTKLSCLEMIKTGTACFSDMYWINEALVRAAEEMGLRTKIGLLLLDFLPAGSKESIMKHWRAFKKRKFNTTTFSIAPHSVYAVSKETLVWAKNFAKRNGLILHSHISETKKEVEDCQKKWRARPVEYLEKIGLLGPNVILAHGVWLSKKEIAILKKRNCSVVYNPCSNLKLASGIMPYKTLKEGGVNICLGTDGPASNNNLDMFEEMKIGSLLQKYREEDSSSAPAKEMFDAATVNGAKALRINSGAIEVGKLADLILIDLNNTLLQPGHCLISDAVYSASGLTVADSICNGKILMRDGEIEGSKEIIRRSRQAAKNLIQK